jgi:hypothetical protein
LSAYTKKDAIKIYHQISEFFILFTKKRATLQKHFFVTLAQIKTIFSFLQLNFAKGPGPICEGSADGVATWSGPSKKRKTNFFL